MLQEQNNKQHAAHGQTQSDDFNKIKEGPFLEIAKYEFEGHNLQK